MGFPVLNQPNPMLRDDRQRPAVLSDWGVDHWLVAAAVGLLLLGLLMVLEASYFVGEERFGDGYKMIRRHAVFSTLAMAVAATMVRLDPRRLRTLVYPALAFGLVLLVLVLIPGIGQVRGGARRWLPLGIVSFEPSELFKPIFIFYLAHSMAKKGPRMEKFAYGVLPHLLVLALPMALLLAEPDFGGTVLLSLVTGAMLFVGGARPLHLAGLASLAAPLGFALIWSSPYRKARLLAFLDPWSDVQGSTFQLSQSLLAFGNGGIAGSGLGQGQQKLFYLPEGHTDFIFALVGEELGLLGALLVLAAYATVMMRGFRVAARASDEFTRLVAFGITFLLVIQAVLNMGVVTGMLPTKGLPLPLLSYGGSSLVTTGAMLGVLLGLSRETR